jgi:cell division protein FtsW
MVNVGIIPVTGQTLPLISLGGSSVMATGLAFGMMLSVSRTLENEKKELMQDATEQQS